MEIEQIIAELQSLSIVNENDIERLDTLCEGIDEKSEFSKENVQKILDALLSILEGNPNVEFGSPGAIVYTLESFFRNGYEEKLEVVVKRTPTYHLAWMLNRVINGVEGEEKEHYLAILKQIAANTNVEKSVREFAKELLEE